MPLLKDMFGEGVLGNLSSIATSSAQMGAQNVIDAGKIASPSFRSLKNV